MNLQDLYSDLKLQLKESGISSPGLDVRLIIKHVLEIDEAGFVAGRNIGLSPKQSQYINKLIQRRLKGEPVSRILGHREFWGLSFKVTPDVLDPRPDSETLIEAARNIFDSKAPETVLDIGTGSGCLLISLLYEWQNTQGTAVDVSKKALSVAKDNARTNKVLSRMQFIQSNWLDDISGQYDLVVSNPPYIPKKEIESLSDEVRKFDPILSLDGGDDGLNAYKNILSSLKKVLKLGGTALFEIGFSQEEDVTRLAIDSGLTVRNIYPDLAGTARVVEISFGEK